NPSGQLPVHQGGWYETATGRQVGPTLPCQDFKQLVAHHGHFAVTVDTDGSVRIVAPPIPAAGSREQVVLQLEIATGHELDDSGQARPLSAAAWWQRKQKLAQLGDPAATSLQAN